MDQSPSYDQRAQEMADAVLNRELEILAQVRTMLEAHRERRLEVRRELHAMVSQFGQFPERDNVRHLRVVKSDKPDDVESSLYV